MKKLLKKAITLSLCVCMVVGMATGASAADGDVSLFSNKSMSLPRLISCEHCTTGKYMMITRNEDQHLRIACRYGYGNTYDLFTQNFRNTYNECNECHRGYLVTSVKTGSSYYCEVTGNVN